MCKFIEGYCKHSSREISRNVAGKQLLHAAYEIISIVADPGISNQLSNYSITVNISGNHTIGVSKSVDLEREGISFIIDVGFDGSIL